MATVGHRKCLCCNDFFDPDRRSTNRQRYCAKTVCRIASKAASQAAWLAKPQNIDYFRDPVHVARVQAWRANHPGYSAGKRAKAGKPVALQDDLIVQVIDSIEDICVRAEITQTAGSAALQDLLNAPTPVLAGLIAHLFDVTLQEDIASTTRRLVQMGHDLIDRSRHENRQTSASP